MKRFSFLSTLLLLLGVFLTPFQARAEYTTTIGITSCMGDSLLINGRYVSYDEDYNSHVYTVRYKALDGSDSTVNYVVNFLPSFHFVEKRYLVLGEKFWWRGQEIDGSRSTYYDRYKTQTTGCDSIYELQVVTVKEKPVYRSSESYTICQSQLPYSWQGQLCTAQGYYYRTFTTLQGADSIAELQLWVVQPVYSMEQFTICRGDEFVTSTGRVIREAGVYRDTLRAASGCDSIHVLVVNYASSYTHTEYRTVNEGEEFEWMGQSYRLYRDETLIHRDNTAINDCDAISQLVVRVIHRTPAGFFLQEEAQTCEGEVYHWRGRGLTEAGTYFDSLRTYDGLRDSVYSLRLTVWPKQELARQITVCDGAKLVVNGREYKDVDVITDTLQTIHGCDSVVHTYINRTRAYHYYDTVYLSNQQSYDWHGLHITAGGSYYDDHKSVDGCDSTYQLEVRLAETYLHEEDTTICHSEIPYVWHKKSYYNTGIYEEVYTSRQGTDSICRLRLTVLPEYRGVEQLYICEGGSVVFNGTTYDSVGTYSTTLKTVGGCDSVITVYVNLAPTYRFHQALALSQKQLPYAWQGQTITKSGAYYASYQSIYNCDSTYTLDVVVDPDYVTTTDTVVCESALPFSWRQKDYNASGSYEDVLKSVLGRDSIFILNLTVKRTKLTSEEAYICAGSTVTVNGVTYREPGVYRNTYTDQDGCDSIHEVIIRMSQSYHFQDSVVISDKQLPYLWHELSLTESGSYTDNLKTLQGCDSVYTLVLTVKNSFLKVEDKSLCESELPFLWHGHECWESKVYEAAYRTADGIDSIYRLNLTVLPTARTTQQVSFCQGGHVTIGNRDYTTAGIVQDTLSAANGCDSVVTYIINPQKGIHTYDTLRLSDKQLPYVWKGLSITGAGTFVQRSVAGNGCDSVAELRVEVYPTYYFKEVKSVCQEDLPYAWHGTEYRESGVFFDYLTTTAGYDSIYELTLKVNPVYRRTEQLYLCEGQSLTLNGQVYHDSQIVSLSLRSQDGCDSIITYVINKLSSYHTYDTLRLANSQLPYNWHGVEITGAGSFRHELQTVFGCDSTEEVYVEVYPTFFFHEDQLLCAQDAESFSWHGQRLTTSGVYYDRQHTVAGFDSIYELNLTVLPSYAQTVMLDICHGESYSIAGRSYNRSCTVVDSLISSTGCDSVVTYILNVHPDYNRYDTIQLSDQQLPYLWYDQSIRGSGNYFHSVQTEAGCLATHQLTVTVYPTYRVRKDTAICASEVPYVWLGQTFYESSQQTVNLKTVAGYDSTLILNLTVYPRYESTQRVNRCQGDAWELNGKSYTESGIYTDTLVSATGCDSVVHYILNVQPVFYHLDTIIARSGETVFWHNRSITVAGNYEDRHQSAYGCDSVYQAYVVFQNAYLLVMDTALCETELPFQWRGRNYYSSGTYSEALKTQQGTDSVYRLNLTVWPAPRSQRHYTLCPGGSITYKRVVYDHDTIFTDTLHTAAGCDSILRVVITKAQSFLRSDTLHISDQDLSRQWRGQTLDHTGTYYEHFQSVEGCDSTYELVVYIHPTYRFVTDTALCEVDAPYHWRGRDYSMLGRNVYTESYRTTLGYDSIYELRLTIYPVYRNHRNLSFCEGDSVRIGSRWYHDEATIYDTTLSTAGCDSVEIYHLHMSHKFYAEESHNMNDGETFTWIRDGKTYGTPGVYWFYGKSVAGCDSVYRLNLTRNPSYHFVEDRDICLTTDSTCYWHGQALTRSGIYWDSLHTVAGQDSVYELHVHAWPSYRFTQQLNICEGGSITFQGRTYTTDGEWIDTLSTVHGCDSILTIKVNITPRFFSSDTVRFSNKETYDWHGQSIHQSGTYYDYNTSKINGCDSTYELVAIVYPTYLFQTDSVVCQSEIPFEWRGQQVGRLGTYTYEDAYSTVAGYDSIYRLNLTVFPETLVHQNIQLCEGETTRFNGRVYAYTCQDTIRLQTENGCDSVIIVNVNVSHRFYQEQTVSFSDDGSYTWPVNGVTYRQPGTYWWYGKTVAGCDSIYRLNLCHDYHVNQAIRLCQGESQWFHGKVYTESGTYLDTLRTQYGCDSIVTISVIVAPTFHVVDTITLCSNEAYPDTLWHGQRIDRAGMFYDAHQTVNGCDSTYELLVIRNPEFRQVENIVICQSEAPYSWRGRDYSELGTHTYEDSYKTQAGCDSVYQLNLTVNPTRETHLQFQTCRGQSVTYNGQSFEPSTKAYEMHFQTTFGCDSVVYLHVNALHGYEVNDTVYLNEGQSYTWRVNGLSYSEQGVYEKYDKTVGGCDSIMRLYLFVHKPVRIDTTVEVCLTELLPFYPWRGHNYTVSGVYHDSILGQNGKGGQLGVDTVYTLNLTVHPFALSYQEIDVCKDMSYTFNDTVITTSGTYEWRGTTQFGCDSIIRLNINFNQVQIERYDTLCDGNELIRYGDTLVDEGYYRYLLPNENGCDTILIDHVTLLYNFNRDFADTICEDQLIHGEPYIFPYSADTAHLREMWGKWNDATGHWEDSTYLSCDRMHRFTLHIVQRPIHADTVHICEGDSVWIRVHGGTYRWVKEAGNYDDTIPSPREVILTGCDSIWRTQVYVYPRSVDTITLHMSDKFLPFRWHMTDTTYVLTETGFYSHTDAMSHGGCDSTTVLHFLVDTTYFFEDSITICKPVYYGPGDSRNAPYLWEGHRVLGLSNYPIFNEGTYWDSLRTVNNADSVYKLVVRFYPTKTTRLTYNLCEGDSMRFGDGWIKHAGVYTDTLYSQDVMDAQFQCDSIVIWTVNMIHSYFTPLSVTISDEQSYTWSLVDSEGDHSRVLNATGLYRDTLKTREGCDSIVELRLTVLPTYHFYERDTVCESQLPYVWTGHHDNKLIYESGTYYDRFRTVAGYDSIYQLALTVIPSYRMRESFTSCAGDSLHYLGKTYTQPGVYQDTLQSSRFCDSVIIIDYRWLDKYFTRRSAETQANHPYRWVEKDIVKVLDHSGVYYDSLKAQNGCDSIICLTLTVYPTYEFRSDTTVCEQDLPLWWHGKTYNESGIYYDSLQALGRADSVYILKLTVLPLAHSERTVWLCSGDFYEFKHERYYGPAVLHDTLTASNHCDSLVTINLMFYQADTVRSVAWTKDYIPYVWQPGERSYVLTQPGLYRDTVKYKLQQQNQHCDSVIYELELRVYQTYRKDTTVKLCAGELPFLWRGYSFMKSTEFSDTVRHDVGSDSIYHLSLQVLDTTHVMKTFTLCQGETLEFNGKRYTRQGQYLDTLTNMQGCDSIVTINLQYHPAYFYQESHTTSDKHPYTWHGKTYTQSGVYYDSLQSVFGCDSTYELTLTVYPTYEFRQDTTVCEQNLPFWWHGKTYNESGTYYDSLQSVHHADSVYILNLTVLPVSKSERTVWLCSGDFYEFKHERYYGPAVLHDTLTASNHCDSLVTINLMFYQADTVRSVAWTKDYIPYIWQPGERSYVLTQPGLYRDTVKYKLQQQNVHCDSLIYELELRVYQTYRHDTVVTVCQSELPFQWRGYNFMESTEFSDTVRHDQGCDSIYNLSLTVLPVSKSERTVWLCSGDFYEFKHERYYGPAVLHDTLTASNHCDSLVTINLMFYQADTVRSQAWTKDYIPYVWQPGERSYVLTQPGLYRDTLKYKLQQQNQHCDSIIYELELRVYQTYRHDTVVTICQSELPFQWRGYHFMESTVFSDTVRHDQGCDSIYNLRLTVWPVRHVTKTFTLCQGETLDYNGKQYTRQGQYLDTLTTADGCDSIVTINLQYHPAYYYRESYTTSDKHPYTWHGKTYTQSGVYYDSLQSVFGCDSTYELTLTVYKSYRFDTLASVCASDLPFWWRGKTYDSTGLYADTLQSVHQTDSIYTLHLTVLDTSMTHYNIVVCEGGSVVYNGRSYSRQGQYLDTLRNRLGCDSIVSVRVQVLPKYDFHEYRRVSAGQPYEWHGRLYSKAGVYYDSLTSVSGCDSVYVLHLHIYSVSDLNIRLCDGETLHYNGHDYPTPGEYFDTIQAANGCDSIVHIHFSQVKTQFYRDSATICSNETYTWSGHHGDAKLKFAGLYRDTVRAEGTNCDSLVYEFRLKVLPTFHGDTTITMCRDEGSLRFGTRDYSESGVYVDTMQASTGCDSIWTIRLTVHDWHVVHIDTTLCENDVFTLHGRRVTEDAHYMDTILVDTQGEWGAAHGCGTIYDYNIHFNRAQHIEFTARTPADQPYTWRYNGQSRVVQYAGDYSDTVRYVRSQCDSIVYHLHLQTYPVYNRYKDTVVCSNDLPFLWNNRSYTHDTLFYDTVRTDTANYYNTVRLKVYQSSYQETTYDLCYGNKLYFNGIEYSRDTVIFDTVPTIHGCDSVTKVTIRVHPIFERWDTVHIGQQDVYHWYVKDSLVRTLRDSGSYVYYGTSNFGCVEAYHLYLKTHRSYFFRDSVNLCDNESETMRWEGHGHIPLTDDDGNPVLDKDGNPIYYMQTPKSGIYYDSLRTAEGYDSIYEHVVVIHKSYFTQETYIINFGASLTLHGKVYKEDGVYLDKLISIDGCDSVFQIVINHPRTITYEEYYETCDNTPFTLTKYGQNFGPWTTTGTYKVVVTNPSTSVAEQYVVHLTVYPAINKVSKLIVAEDSVPYYRDGHAYALTDDGQTFDYINSSVHGCDSINRVTFIVVPEGYYNRIPDVQYFCPGSSVVTKDYTVSEPRIVDSVYLALDPASPGQYHYFIHRIEYKYAPVYTFYDTIDTYCTRDLPVKYHGVDVTGVGDYKAVFTSIYGCDSIFYLHVGEVLQSPADIVTDTVCFDFQGYVWPMTGRLYKEAGTYEYSVPSPVPNTCDQYYVLNLRVVKTDTTWKTTSICSTELPYTWNYYGANDTVITGPLTEPVSIRMVDPLNHLYSRLFMLDLTVDYPITDIRVRADSLCQDRSTFRMHISYDGTKPSTYSVFFSKDALQNGFQNVDNRPYTPIHDAATGQDWLTVGAIPTSALPGRYPYTLQLGGASCGTSSVVDTLVIPYEANIFNFHWNTTIAVSRQLTSPYTFSSYTWHVTTGGSTPYALTGTNGNRQPYFYYKDGLQAGYTVYIDAVRDNDILGIAVPSCPYEIQESDLNRSYQDVPIVREGSDITVINTSAPLRAPQIRMASVYDGTYRVYSLSGELIESGNFRGDNVEQSLKLPSVSGFYLLEAEDTEGFTVTKKLLIY